MKTLLTIKSKLSSLVPLSIVFGLAAGYFMNLTFLKALVTYVLFLMVYPMMINLDITEVARSYRNPKPILLSLLLNFTLTPMLVWILGRTFFVQEPMMLMGLVLMGLLPTSGMTASWTGLGRGNLKMALVMMAVNLIVAMGAIPVYIQWILGQTFTIDPIIIAKSLVQVVIVPLVLGDLTRRIILKRAGQRTFKAMKPYFGGVSSLGVIIIVFIAVALKSKVIVEKLDLVLLSVVPLMVFYASVMLISHFLGKRYLPREDRIALVYATTLRNLTISLGISLNLFGDSLAVFIIAIAYVVQLPFATMYLRYLNLECDADPGCQLDAIMG